MVKTIFSFLFKKNQKPAWPFLVQSKEYVCHLGALSAGGGSGGHRKYLGIMRIPSNDIAQGALASSCLPDDQHLPPAVASNIVGQAHSRHLKTR